MPGENPRASSGGLGIASSDRDNQDNLPTDAVNTMRLQPNPAASACDLYYVSDLDASIHLHMVGLNGGLVKNITAKVDAGENVVHLDLSDLAEGVYWVSLSTEKAMQTEHLVIFKN